MSRQLDNWLESYLNYTRHSESPEQFHYWTGVATIAGALRRKVWLEMGYFQWTPNFFIFLIAPPAIVSKSTSANIGAKLLKQVEDVKFGPSSVTWQALLDTLAGSLVTYPMEPGSVLDARGLDMCAVTIIASELGTFLDPSNREMVDLMNDLWDGKDVPFVRRTRGEGEKSVVNPWINLLACTTPAWIADNVNAQFASGGLASRSVFVYAEVKRHLIAYPFLQLPNDHSVSERELVHDLQHIAGLRGPFTLTPRAVKWGTEWYEKHYYQILTNTDKYRGHIDRKQTHLHKLAMVLSAAKRDDLKIDEAELMEADHQLSALEPDIPRVFAAMNREQVVDLVFEAVGILRKRPLPPEELFRVHFMGRISYETFNHVVMDGLMNSHTVNLMVAGGTSKLVVDEAKLLKTATETVSQSQKPPAH